MNIRFFTDPHIGLNRTAHTTPASRAKLKQALAAQAIAVAYNVSNVVCLGDLFDTFDTDNRSLLAGIDIFSWCDLVLFGNHDLSNRTDLLSSIEVAVEIDGQEGGIRAGATVPLASTTRLSGINLWWVDHKLTQEIFEGAVQDAFNRTNEGSILLLHCNYDSPFATQESTLNITRADVELLLTKFSYVLIGHEHMSRKDFDGRLILLGNTHPTGFSDISDKFVWDFEIENGEVKAIVPTRIWSEDTGYLALDWTDLSELESLSPSVQFVQVNGTATQQHMPLISAQVAKIWMMSDNLLMVRNNVFSTELDNEVTVNEFTRCQSVPERISAELAGTKFEPLWKSYLEIL